MRSFLIYSAARLGIFILVWGLLTLIFPKINWMFTGVLAAVVAMLISVLFLGKLRQALALDVQGRVHTRVEKRRARTSRAERDAEDEDRLIDDDDAENDDSDTRTESPMNDNDTPEPAEN